MKKATSSELPYETYERVTGKRWVSGKSSAIKSLLQAYGIKAPAGSEQANAELQRALKAAPNVALGTKAPTLPTLPSTVTPGAIPDQRSPIDVGYAAMRTSPRGSVAETFTPEEWDRLNAALPSAALLYGTGAALGAGAGLGASAGLSEMTPQIFTQAVRDAITRGNQAEVQALLRNAEETARLARGGAPRVQALRDVNALRMSLARMLNPLD